jgi:hypothetical protein
MKRLRLKIMTRLSTCRLLRLVRVLLFTLSLIPTPNADPHYTPHFDVPDYKLAGMQLFDTMHSFKKDDATDSFYATEKENIDDTGLLEASGFSTSPSQWNFFELSEDGK